MLLQGKESRRSERAGLLEFWLPGGSAPPFLMMLLMQVALPHGHAAVRFVSIAQGTAHC